MRCRISRRQDPRPEPDDDDDDDDEQAQLVHARGDDQTGSEVAFQVLSEELGHELGRVQHADQRASSLLAVGGLTGGAGAILGLRFPMSSTASALSSPQLTFTAVSAVAAGAALVALLVAVSLSVAVLMPRSDLRVKDHTFGKIYTAPTTDQANRAAALIRRGQVKKARKTGDLKMGRLKASTIATLVALIVLALAALSAVAGNVVQMVGD